jgi:3-deoxy-D-manno-octulosonate 8-phosphate phosphatase (KDO 8-P phosphatase)
MNIDFTKIDLLVLDVDGVMTDGKVILTPAGEEIKEFHARDGAGIKYWRRAGKKVAMITGRGSPVIAMRAKELGVDAFRVDAKTKLPAYREVLAELGVTPDRTAVMGDDLPDLPLFRRCALPVAVADAVSEVREAAAYVTRACGGQGAVREVIELILKNTGDWQTILSRYTGDSEEPRPC